MRVTVIPLGSNAARPEVGVLSIRRVLEVCGCGTSGVHGVGPTSRERECYPPCQKENKENTLTDAEGCLRANVSKIPGLGRRLFM